MKCVACHARDIKIGILEKTLLDNKTLISKETYGNERDSFEKFNSCAQGGYSLTFNTGGVHATILLLTPKY